MCGWRETRPRPRYGLEALRRSRWRATGGWFRGGDGTWRRVYAAGPRARRARRALVWRAEGLWRWRVEEFALEAGQPVRGVCALGSEGYLFERIAWRFADLAARSE